MEIKQKTCETCLYLATHECCDNCLGSIKEVEENNNEYLYRHWIEGDGIARIKEWEKDGRSNIVIGGTGEAEVNTKWTPEETLESLISVSEECGYLTTKGRWNNQLKEIYVVTEGKYRLTYWNNRLETIDKIIERPVWSNI